MKTHVVCRCYASILVLRISHYEESYFDRGRARNEHLSAGEKGITGQIIDTSLIYRLL